MRAAALTIDDLSDLRSQLPPGAFIANSAALVDPAKIAKLVRMLGSDNDGEVVASARAIGRMLEASSLDFNDLGDAVELLELRPRIEREELLRMARWLRECGALNA